MLFWLAKQALIIEILIHVLKILAPANASEDHLLSWYLFHAYDENFSSREIAHAQIKYQESSTSGRGARASYQTMFPEISARWSLWWAKFQIPVVSGRQWGREMSAPRPYVTDPFHPLSSVYKQ